MSEHVDQVDAATMMEMRAFANDCGWDDCSTDEEILAAIDQRYVGGATQFVRDGDPS